MNKLERIERVQSLLDSGITNISEISRQSGEWRRQIKRWLDSGEVEIYVPFDEQNSDYIVQPSQTLDCYVVEDFLDEVCKTAFYSDVYLCEYTVLDDNIRTNYVSTYIKENYKSLEHFLLIKGYNHLADCIFIRCRSCEKIKPISDLVFAANAFMGHGWCLDCNARTCGEWRKSNPAKFKSIYNKRRLLVSSSGDTFDDADWKEILTYFDNCCAFCGSSKNISVDHFIPISKGGGNGKDNIIPLCRSCNSRKRDFNPFEIMKKYNVDKQKEIKILSHLSVLNEMSEEEYTSYIEKLFKFSLIH